jgi:hypothetical protein
MRVRPGATLGAARLLNRCVAVTKGDTGSQPARTISSLVRDLLPARGGRGPLLERDYWATIARCRASPSELVSAVAARFWELAPPDVVEFERVDGTDEPLREGDEMQVRIPMAGTFRVRVVRIERQSLTIATLRGHPEAGRITFGAYRNDYGDVVFHIRSRARSGSSVHYAGFLTAGDAMQTSCWADFVIAVARTFGDGVVGPVHAEKRKLSRDEADDERTLCSPTFAAVGD